MKNCRYLRRTTDPFIDFALNLMYADWRRIFEVIFRMDLYLIYYWSWQPHHRHSSKRISLKTIWILISFIWKIVSRYWETGTQQQNHRFTFFFTLVYDLNSYRTIHILWYCWFSIYSWALQLQPLLDLLDWLDGNRKQMKQKWIFFSKGKEENSKNHLLKSF